MEKPKKPKVIPIKSVASVDSGIGGQQPTARTSLGELKRRSSKRLSKSDIKVKKDLSRHTGSAHHKPGHRAAHPSKPRQQSRKSSPVSTLPVVKEDNDDDDPDMVDVMAEDEMFDGTEEDYKFPEAFADLERLGYKDRSLSSFGSEIGQGGSEEFLGEEIAGEDTVDFLGLLRDYEMTGPRSRRYRSKQMVKELREDDEESGEITQEWVEPEYYREDFISRPLTFGENVEITDGVLKLYHSFGFDSSRQFNLQCLDSDHVLYICGNYLHFYNLPLGRTVFFHRSASGHGFGHVAIHPSRKYFAVGEKGDKPFIIVYTWPDLQVFRVLRKGTLKAFAHLDFNPSGDLLCSQGHGPDFMLTIWDWFHEKVILRHKGTHEMYRVIFTAPTLIVAAGSDTFQFFRITETEITTDTGLVTVSKFIFHQGDYGQNPYQIYGFTGISNGRVVAGDPNGNMIIWNDARAELEIGRDSEPYLGGRVMDIQPCDSELLTVAQDGFVRTWRTDLIENAVRGPEGTSKVEIEPELEIRLGIDFEYQPVSAVRVPSNPNRWLIQDSWGKVWDVDVAAAKAFPKEYVPSTLFLFPGGAVTGMATSTRFSIMVVGTSAGHLCGFEYTQKIVIARMVYAAAVSKVLWIPERYDPTGRTVLVGFDDGTVRLMALNPMNPSRILSDVEISMSHELSVIQRLKFHKGAVTVMKIEPDGDILWTTGADRVIFGSKIEIDGGKPVVVPLAFVTSPFVVASLDFHPTKNYRFVIASRGGRVAECRRPVWSDLDSQISYNMGKLHGKRWWYKSVKSERRREEDRQVRKRKKSEEYEQLRQNIEDRRAAGMLVAETLEFSRVRDRYRRQQLAEDEKELEMPTEPCPILSVYYYVNPRIANMATGMGLVGQTFFLHVGGFDAGYVYECKYNRPEAGGFHKVPPNGSNSTAGDIGVSCFLASPDDLYLLFGMMDGSIRVMGRNNTGATPEWRLDNRPLSTMSVSESSTGSEMSILATEPRKDILPPFPVSVYPYDLQNFWSLPMHDPDHGPVVELGWSFDSEFLISVGSDGSIFAYRWDPAGKLNTAEDSVPEPVVPQDPFGSVVLFDIDDPEAPTLEELRATTEADRIFQMTEATKEIIRRDLRKLKEDYRALKEKNNQIPEQFRLPAHKFEVDPRIHLSRQARFAEQVTQVYRHWEWDGTRSVIQCDKIRKYFLNGIQSHHKTVSDLDSDLETHSFRHQFLSEGFYAVCESNQGILAEEKLVAAKAAEEAEMKKLEAVVPVEEEPRKRCYAKDLIGTYEGKYYNVKTMHAIKQLEDRLNRRYLRETEWAELNVIKVPDNFEADEDVAAIKLALESTAEYKMKSSEDFILEDTTTMAERRQKILDLKLMMFSAVKDFNDQLEGLEKEKIQVISVCRNLQAQIAARQNYLPENQRLPVPTVPDVDVASSPEHIYDVSEPYVEAVQNARLLEAGLLERKKMAFHEKSDESDITAMPGKPKRHRTIRKPGDFQRNRNDPRAPKVVLKTLPKPLAKRFPDTIVMPVVNRDETEGLTEAVWEYRQAFLKPKTDAALRRRDRILARKLFERDYFVERLQKVGVYFKNRVQFLINERIALQVDVNLMMIGLLTLIQELNVVRDFEEAERTSMARYEQMKSDFEISKRRLDKSRMRLNQAKRDQRKVQVFLTQLAKEVAICINHQGRFSEFLWKVYRKRIDLGNADEEEDELPTDSELILNVASEANTQGGSETEASLSSGSGSFYSFPKLRRLTTGLNICPDELDREIFDKVCSFRQQKTFLEADFDTQKNIVDRLTADHSVVTEVHRDLRTGLSGLQSDINSLQRNRQTLVNELKKLVILRVNQVQYFDEHKLDQDHRGQNLNRIKRNLPNPDKVIVFPKDGTQILDQRFDELKGEIEKQKKKEQRARYMIVRLREELRKKENRVTSLLDQCRKDMIGRFGRVVDMEELCAGSIHLEILDIEKEMETKRKTHYKESDRMQQRILETRRDLATATQGNTELNVMLAILEERQRDVDYFLFEQKHKRESRSAEEMVDYVNGDVIGDMYQLEDRLMVQQARIGYLRETIATCKIKGKIPELTLMTSMTDEVASRFITLRELKEYKEYLNREVQFLYNKNNTEEFLQSTSVMPSAFNVTRAAHVLKFQQPMAPLEETVDELEDVEEEPDVTPEPLGPSEETVDELEDVEEEPDVTPEPLGQEVNDEPIMSPMNE